MAMNSNLSYIKFLRKSGINFFLQDIPKKFYEENKLSINQNLSENIENINNLKDLREYINNSNICNLKQKANQAVFADGNPLAKIMLIGEAPGAEEDKLGKPFVGLAGKLLDKMLAAIKLDRNLVYITNIVPWRPPNNRTPNDKEILECLPFIQKHIELINPKMIILLGGTATKAVLASPIGITKLRGKWHRYNALNIKNSILTRAMYHPAFLLRSPNYKKQAWEDLQEIKIKISKLDYE